MNNPVKYNAPSGHNPLLLGIYLAIRIITVKPFENPRTSLPKGRDVTSWTIKEMKTNASLAESGIKSYATSGTLIKEQGALEAWTAMVSEGGPWDLKVNLNAALNLRKNPNIYLGDGEGAKSFNYQAVANMHFGYVGAAAGFDSNLLEIGAGVAQVLSNSPDTWGTPSTKFDQPFDNWWIKFGDSLYDKYGLDQDELDEEEFELFLDSYIEENGGPPPLEEEIEKDK